jgi:hypothetical protein
MPEPTGVRCDDATLSVDLADGRTITVPLLWFPRLFHGTPTERANFELGAWGVHWPDLNEDIPVEGLLLGQKSGESLKSIKRWLDLRAKGLKEEIPHLPLPDWFTAKE